MPTSDAWLANIDDHSPELALQLLRREPAELLAIGGDDRQVPVAGRNAYGFPLTASNPSVRGSSCTATPPDDVALQAAAAWSSRLRTAVIARGAMPDVEDLRAPIVARIGDALGLGLDVDRALLLTASGTDVETIVAAMMLATSSRPLRNIVLGARETGSGTAAAAAGRIFSARAPFRSTVVDCIVGVDPQE